MIKSPFLKYNEPAEKLLYVLPFSILTFFWKIVYNGVVIQENLPVSGLVAFIQGISVTVSGGFDFKLTSLIRLLFLLVCSWQAALKTKFISH